METGELRKYFVPRVDLSEQADPLLLDEVAIDSILSLGPEFFKKVLAAFELSWEEDLIRLQQSLAEEDCQGVSASAHRMKSSSANLGAVGLSSACAAIEAAARDRQIQGIAAEVVALDMAYERYSRVLFAVAERGSVS